MSPAKSRRPPSVPPRLRDIVSHECGDGPFALALFEEFLSSKAYSESFASKLISLGKGDSGAPWEVRRLAAFVLENQVLKVSPDDAGEFDLLFVRLGLKPLPGEGCGVAEYVLKEV